VLFLRHVRVRSISLSTFLQLSPKISIVYWSTYFSFVDRWLVYDSLFLACLIIVNTAIKVFYALIRYVIICMLLRVTNLDWLFSNIHFMLSTHTENRRTLLSQDLFFSLCLPYSWGDLSLNIFIPARLVVQTNFCNRKPLQWVSLSLIRQSRVEKPPSAVSSGKVSRA